METFGDKLKNLPSMLDKKAGCVPTKKVFSAVSSLRVLNRYQSIQGKGYKVERGTWGYYVHLTFDDGKDDIVISNLTYQQVVKLVERLEK